MRVSQNISNSVINNSTINQSASGSSITQCAGDSNGGIFKSGIRVDGVDFDIPDHVLGDGNMSMTIINEKHYANGYEFIPGDNVWKKTFKAWWHKTF